jgi:DNA-binding CsgD family transcriptional regulator
MPLRTAPIVETDDNEGGLRSRLALVGVFVLLAAGFAADLVLDRPQDWRSGHVIFEVSLVLISLGYAAFLWRGWRVASRSLAAARASLEAQRGEREAWQESARAALDGLGQAIDNRFATWQLTPVEREVALLLLKGHGHKQIAAMTHRSERTVRQHAVAVYAKSGLGGRAELAAFFLEGVMLPQGAASTRPQHDPD